MKKLFFVLNIIFLISCLNTYSDIIENIEVEKFYKLLQKNAGLILDVRTAEEFNSGCIKDATNIDFYSNDFIDKLNLIKKDIPIYIYCRSGGRSSAAAIKMEKLGFSKVYNLVGGIKAWELSKYSLSETKKVKSKKRRAPIFSISKISQILNNNTIVLLEFSTDWCLPCKKMKPLIQEIKNENPNIKCIVIDADRNKELVANYQIQSVPTFIIFKNNIEIFRNNGIISKTELLDHLLRCKK